MRFGLFYEHQLPRPWAEGAEEILLRIALEQVELADRIGIDFVWEVEHEDEATAIERGIDGGHFFGYSLGHYYVYGRHRPGRTSLWEEFERHRHEHGFARDIINARGDSLGIRLLEAGLGSMRGAIGSPDQIAELTSRYEAAGVDQMILVAQSGNNAHEHVCDSLELFGKEVLPRFAPDAAAKEQEKAERLEQTSRAALGRRAPARSADSSYVVTSQGEKEPARVPLLSPREEAEASPEDVFLESLRGRSDAELTELTRTTPTLELIFGGMAESFVSEEAGGFSGDIAYELTDDNDRYAWTVTVDGSEAKASAVRSRSPALVVRTDVCTFLRIVSGEDNGALATIRGRVRLEGDPKVALKLGAMFGRSQY